MGEKRFAVLLCAEDSEFVKKKYGGYFGVFVGMLGDEGETWDVFRVCSGEFPEEKELGCFDGFVISGSCSDAHGNDLWICKLLNLLKKLDSMKKRVLGICFGHQILSRALGGKTGRAESGWDIGITTINLSSSNHLFTSLQIPSMLSVIEFHRDEVRELPPSAEVMAWSNKTGIEMFKCGDHIMGIQGHPEYTKDILLNLLDRLLQRNLIQDSHAETAKASIEAGEPDREAWKRLCKSFLKGRLIL
ncbi:Glutamine amidotransferase [Macleaya cordata]|uniref:Glutamine amidotransferase n=1 Tax=Macleaya cordata TaxID=56857 RepID=A0A200PUF5_MACCD|nr:Glutamine amidotransferase [Macleaya cordata]